MSHGIYTIKQAADATGLSRQVIRKWEERYSLVAPKRLDNGYRIYSEADLQLLRQVKTLSEQGFTIRQAAELAKQKIGTPLPVNRPDFAARSQGNEQMIGKLLLAGTNCDELELSVQLQNAYLLLGLEPFLETVIIPFLKEVGRRWETGEWNEYQESVSSIVVRDFLVQIRRSHTFREEAPMLLAACLPEERHELPLHIVSLQSIMRGYKTVLVGASPAPGAIQSLVKRLRPDKVLLSATTTMPFEKDPGLLQELDEFAAAEPDIDFYIGGAGAELYTPLHPAVHITMTNRLEDVL